MANDKLGYFSVFGFLGRYLYFGRYCVLPVSFLYRSCIVPISFLYCLYRVSKNRKNFGGVSKSMMKNNKSCEKLVLFYVSIYSYSPLSQQYMLFLLDDYPL